ncbi:MAG: Hpt domain-containing protein [Chitinophagaceae bacterium]
MGNDKETVNELMLMMQEQLQILPLELYNSIKNDDRKAVKSLAHQLKGSAYSMSLITLGNLALKLESGYELPLSELLDIEQQMKQEISYLLENVLNKPL